MSKRSQRRWKNEYGDWKTGWAIGAWLGAIVLFVGAITGGAAAIDRGVCLSKLDAMGQPGSWGPLQGCMVVINGTALPIDNYRGNQDLGPVSGNGDGHG